MIFVVFVVFQHLFYLGSSFTCLEILFSKEIIAYSFLAPGEIWEKKIKCPSKITYTVFVYDIFYISHALSVLLIYSAYIQVEMSIQVLQIFPKENILYSYIWGICLFLSINPGWECTYFFVSVEALNRPDGITWLCKFWNIFKFIGSGWMLVVN